MERACCATCEHSREMRQSPQAIQASRVCAFNPPTLYVVVNPMTGAGSVNGFFPPVDDAASCSKWQGASGRGTTLAAN